MQHDALPTPQRAQMWAQVGKQQKKEEGSNVSPSRKTAEEGRGLKCEPK